MTDSGTQQKRPGRREKQPGQPKSGVMTFRVRAGMREKLQASADARGLSISEEVERRLNLSFDIATSPHNEYVIRSAADALNMVESVNKMKWTDNVHVANMCHDAVAAATSVMTAIYDRKANQEAHKLVDAGGDVLGIRTALIVAGFPKEAVVKFGRTDVDLAIDQIRRRVLGQVLDQVDKAAERDPDGVTVMVDAEQLASLGTTPPHLENPEKLEAGLCVMDQKRAAKAASRKSRSTETPRAD